MRVADPAQPLHVAVGRDEDSVRADDRLHDDGRDGVAAFVADDLLGVAEDGVHGLGVLLPPAMEIRDAHDAGNARLRGPAPGIPGERERTRRPPVIRTIAHEDLVAPGDDTRHADRVLHRFRAAVREEEGVDVAGRDLGQLRPKPRPHFRGHEGIGVGQGGRLLLDGLHHLGMGVADVRAHELAVEVQVALAFGRPEVDAFRARDRDGVDLGLRRPLEHRVLAAEGDDLLAAQVTHDFRSFGRHQRALLMTGIPSRRLLDQRGWTSRSTGSESGAGKAPRGEPVGTAFA